MLFRKAANFCQGIETKQFGLFYKPSFKNLRMPEETGLKQIKEILFGFPRFFLLKYACQFIYVDTNKSQK